MRNHIRGGRGGHQAGGFGHSVPEQAPHWGFHLLNLQQSVQGLLRWHGKCHLDSGMFTSGNSFQPHKVTKVVKYILILIFGSILVVLSDVLTSCLQARMRTSNCTATLTSQRMVKSFIDVHCVGKLESTATLCKSMLKTSTFLETLPTVANSALRTFLQGIA